MAELFDTYFIYAFWLCILYRYGVSAMHVTAIGMCMNVFVRLLTLASVYTLMYGLKITLLTLYVLIQLILCVTVSLQKRDVKEAELSALRDKLRGKR